MRLYIRDRSRFINFVHTVAELRSFVDDYLYGTPAVWGFLCCPCVFTEFQFCLTDTSGY